MQKEVETIFEHVQKDKVELMKTERMEQHIVCSKKRSSISTSEQPQSKYKKYVTWLVTFLIIVEVFRWIKLKLFLH